MNVDAVAGELVARLETIAGLRCYKGAPASVTPPAAVVFLPGRIEYSQAYNRGVDRLIWPVSVLAGRVADRTVMERLGAYLDGSGSASVKAVLESGTYTSFDSVFVASADTDPETWGDATYAGATFELHIVGRGSS